jgi:hypothetical protein
MNPILVTEPALKPWIGRGQVIASRWSDKEANLLVVIQRAHNSSYYLFRAFRVGDKIAISTDVSLVDEHQMIACLIDRIP